MTQVPPCAHGRTTSCGSLLCQPFAYDWLVAAGYPLGVQNLNILTHPVKELEPEPPK